MIDATSASFVVEAFELPRPTLQITSDVGGPLNAAEVFDLLGCAESCEVLQGRLSKVAVRSSRQSVSRSLFRLLGDCAHIAATFVGPSETKIDARYLEKLAAEKPGEIRRVGKCWSTQYRPGEVAAICG
jgi:hypothetical protein